MPFLKKISEGFLLSVHIQPQASKNTVVGLHDDRLKIKIKAPPVDGAANKEVVEFLAKTLGLSKRQVHIKSGETSRQKNLLILTDDLTGQDIRQRLASMSDKPPRA